ncbi:MAG: RNA-binding S4 domain-containing protein [Clostridia bacterium]|nr:RNA-binding S4 domain-containing protein [Clostridia bacterium]
MRIDKYLKVSRILKRRSLSKEACDGDRVFVNGKQVKPSYKLSVGDVIEVAFGSGTLKIRVLSLKEQVKKDEVSSLYEILGE